MRINDTVTALHEGLDFHQRRHTLLTANLAHLDTPGFHALDLARQKGFDHTLKAELATTNPGHLTGTTAKNTSATVIESTQVTGSDDNGVSIDREATKIAANNVRYDALANLLAGELSMVNWAANDGKAG